MQASDQSELTGLPVALLGPLTYTAILVGSIIRGELGRLAGALLALVGFGFSVYLTIESLTVIGATCRGAWRASP